MTVFNAAKFRVDNHNGFKPVACRPYQANTMGQDLSKCVTAIVYLGRKLLYAHIFRDLEDSNTGPQGGPGHSHYPYPKDHSK